MPSSKLAPKKPSGVASVFGRKKSGSENAAAGQCPNNEPVRWPLSAAPGSEQRCALILYGLPKLFRDRSFPTLLQRVIMRIPMPVDVFIHTYNLTETSNMRNGEVACKLDPQEVHVAKPLRLEMQSQDLVDREHQPLLNEMKRYGDAWFNHFVSLRNVLRQYNSIRRVSTAAGCTGARTCNDVRQSTPARAPSSSMSRRCPLRLPRCLLPHGCPVVCCCVRAARCAGVRTHGGGAEADRRGVHTRLLLAHGRAVPG